MTKIHTRKKRLLGLGTSLQHRSFFTTIVKAKRPKTFRTKEQAEEYAKEKSLKNVEIVTAKKGKRFKIERKE